MATAHSEDSLQRYFDELAHYPRLTRSEEQALFQIAESAGLRPSTVAA